MDTLFIPGWLITGLIVAVIIVVLLVKGYVNAKPNEVVVITGLRKQRHLKGLRQKCNVVNKSAWQLKPIS